MPLCPLFDALKPLGLRFCLIRERSLRRGESALMELCDEIRAAFLILRLVYGFAVLGLILTDLIGIIDSGANHRNQRVSGMS